MNTEEIYKKKTAKELDAAEEEMAKWNKRSLLQRTSRKIGYKMGIPPTLVYQISSAFLAMCEDELVGKGSLSFPGFGSFVVKKRKMWFRKCENGYEKKTEDYLIPTFRAYKALRSRVGRDGVEGKSPFPGYRKKGVYRYGLSAEAGGPNFTALSRSEDHTETR